MIINKTHNDEGCKIAERFYSDPIYNSGQHLNVSLPSLVTKDQTPTMLRYADAAASISDARKAEDKTRKISTLRKQAD